MNRDAMYFCPSTLLPDTYALTVEQFDEYLKVCFEAELDGISWWTLHHYLLVGAGLTLEEIKAKLLAHDLDVIMTEALPEWGNESSADDALAKAAGSIEIAAQYGSPYLAAVMLEEEMASIEQAAKNLAAIADEAAKSNINVCVEFLPWSGIPNIEVCWDLIQRTERDNVGVLFDSWHWHRQVGGPTGRNAEVLASMPGSAAMVLQLCDAQERIEEDAMSECMARRPVPGAGVVDHAQFFGLLHEIGADPFIAPEVFNSELRNQGMKTMVTEVLAGTREALALWPTAE